MFSREESKKLRQQFWTSFGLVYRRKWILYDTKIKEIQLKFSFDRKQAIVSIDVVADDELIRAYFFEKLLSLRKILQSEYLPEVIFDENFELPEGKIISRAYVQKTGLSIHNRNDWPAAMAFLAENMAKLEEFFQEYRDMLEE